MASPTHQSVSASDSDQLDRMIADLSSIESRISKVKALITSDSDVTSVESGIKGGQDILTGLKNVLAHKKRLELQFDEKKGEVESLEERIRDLTREKQELRPKVDSLLSQHTELEGKLDTGNQELTNIQHQVQSAKEDLEQIRNNSGDLQAKETALTRRETAVTTEEARLANMLTGLVERDRSLQVRERDVEQANTKILQERASVDDTREEVSSLETETRQKYDAITQAVQENKKVVQRNEELLKKIRKDDATLVAARHNLVTMSNQTQDETRLLNMHKNRVEKRAEALSRAFRKLENVAVQSHTPWHPSTPENIDKFTDIITGSILVELKRLNQDNASYSETIANLKQEIFTSTNTHAQDRRGLVKQLQKTQSELKDAEILAKQSTEKTKALEQENMQHAAELQKSSLELKTARADLDVERERLQKLQDQLQQRDEKIAENTVEHLKIQHNIEKLEQTVAELRPSPTEASRLRRELRTERERAEQAVRAREDYRCRVQNHKAQVCEEMKGQWREYRTTINETREQQNSLIVANSAYMQELDKQRVMILSLEEKIRSMEDRENDLKRKFKKMAPGAIEWARRNKRKSDELSG
jgi:chromosome segregation ATPase